MKFLERFALVVYSYIIILLAFVVTLMIFNWMEVDVVTSIINEAVNGAVSSKIILGVCIVLVILSVKCIFFDESAKERLKESQGVLMKNENGELMISKDSIESIVKNATTGFENVKDCNTKINVDEENQVEITLNITVNENVVIKDLASNLQTKVKDEVKKISDLDVKEVNVKILNLQSNKKSKEKIKDKEEE